MVCLGLPLSQVATYGPADLLTGWEDFDQDCVDITVASPVATMISLKWKKFTEEEEEELRKHRKNCLPRERSGYGLQAIAVVVFGVMATNSHGLLRRNWTIP